MRCDIFGFIFAPDDELLFVFKNETQHSFNA